MMLHSVLQKTVCMAGRYGNSAFVGENKMYISVFTGCRNLQIFYLFAVAYHDITGWLYSKI